MQREAISLGWNCSSAGWAVDNGIRNTRANGYRTCPFDEMLSNYNGVVECIRSNFEGFTDPENLSLKSIPTTSRYCTGDDLIYNSRYKFLFNHESPGHANLYVSQAWPGGKTHYVADNWKFFRERYDRRIESFRTYMRSGIHILFVITHPGSVQELEDALREQYPDLSFSVVRLDVRDTDHYCQHMELMQ